PPRARDGLRLRLARRAARLPRRRPPALPLPAPRLARSAHRHARARPLLGARRRRDRGRLPPPGLRERRHDDGDRAYHRHPAPVRERRRLVDDLEPRRDGHPPRDLRARPRTALVAFGPLALWNVAKEVRLAASDDRALALAGAAAPVAALEG